MPDLHVRRQRSAASPAASARPARVAVLGDLMLDVVLSPTEPIRAGTDVPGFVALRQGGSAANTARWLARLGAKSSLICAIGRDPAGRALVASIEAHGVTVRAVRLAGVRTGRIGVLVAPDGERSFVADRAAADRLSPADLRPAWFAGLDLLHLPAYSLLTEPLGAAAQAAIRLARDAHAIVSIDLASVGPIVASGPRRAREAILAAAPDLLFATATEASALLDGAAPTGLAGYAPIVVVKRGAKGATVLQRAGPAGNVIRFEVATQRVVVADTTGAGDAFDAGFILGWLGSEPARRASQAALHRAALAGHRAAVRQLTSAPTEVSLA